MTIEEILKQSGLTDDQIKAIDARAMSGLTTVLTTATASEQAAATERQKAELAQRAQQDLYSKEIAPALDAWATEKANKEAEIAFYRTQAEQAKVNGFVPKEAPGYKHPERNADGTFVANANAVPGSPAFLTAKEAMAGISNATWAMQEHIRLYGQPMPDEFESLLNEATSQHLTFRDHVERKYKFAEKKNEIAQTRQKEHDDGIRKETAAAKDKEWAEKIGNNPNVRVATASDFATLNKASAAGQRKDPLLMSTEERRRHTQEMIRNDMAENEHGAVN